MRRVVAIIDYGEFAFGSKDEVLDKARRYWNPGKTEFWTDAGVPLVIDRREGYFLYDMSGSRLIDVHLNGGTYNLGHRNPDVVADLVPGAAPKLIVLLPLLRLSIALVIRTFAVASRAPPWKKRVLLPSA